MSERRLSEDIEAYVRPSEQSEGDKVDEYSAEARQIVHSSAEWEQAKADMGRGHIDSTVEGNQIYEVFPNSGVVEDQYALPDTNYETPSSPNGVTRVRLAGEHDLSQDAIGNREHQVPAAPYVDIGVPITREISHISVPKEIGRNLYIDGNYLVRLEGITLHAPITTIDDEFRTYKTATEYPLFLNTDDGQKTYLSLDSFRMLTSGHKGDVLIKEAILDEIDRRVNAGELRPELTEIAHRLVELSMKASNDRKPNSGSGEVKADPIIRERPVKSALSIYSFRKYRKVPSELVDAVRVASGKKGDFLDIKVFDGAGNLTKSGWRIITKGLVDNYSSSYVLAIGSLRQSKGKWIRDLYPDWSFSMNEKDLIELKQAVFDLVKDKISQQDREIIAGIIVNHDFVSRHRNDSSSRVRRSYREKDGKLILLMEDSVDRKTEASGREAQSTLVQKIDEIEGAKVFEVSGDEIKRQIMAFALPYGATINRLNIVFTGNLCDIEGNVNVPMPLVGGDVKFSMNLSNRDNSGLSVSNLKLQASNSILQGQVAAVSDQFKNIDATLLREINYRLKKNNVRSMLLGEGKFIFQVGPR